MFILKSNHIKDFEFDKYARLTNDGLVAQAKAHGLASYASWMLPQIVHYYGSWQLVYKDGFIDPTATARQNIQDDYAIGLWRVVTQLKRSSLLKSQTAPDSVNYSALVPLILAGAKKYQGVEYTRWNIDAQCPLIEANLLEAMLWQPEPDSVLKLGEPRYGLSTERILELRTHGLTPRTGVKAGILKSPASAWSLTGMRSTELATMPKLAQTMLTQIWVAHPSLRTNYMILDPQNWDQMPEPLTTSEIFGDKKSTKTKKPTVTTLPWLQE